MAVQLSGYQGPQGFKSRQPYDPTKALQEGARRDEQYRQAARTDYGNRLTQLGEDLEQQAKGNIQAYAQFSQTLSDTLVKAQEKENDRQYKLGLAEVMNGNVDFPDEVYNKHEEDKAKLEAGVRAEGQVANQLEADGKPVEAARVRRDGRAAKGWFAYGQAVGTAKLAALRSQQELLTFWTGTDKIIPTPEGMKSPSQVAASGTDEELAAGNAIVLNRITDKYGLAGINPVIIAEEFSPTWQATSSNISSGLLQQIDANRKEDANRKTSNSITLDVYKASKLSPEQATAVLSKRYQEATTSYENLGGMTKGKAADMALETTLAAIQKLPKEQALVALAAFEKVAKVAKDPGTGTIGQLHADKFDEARNNILTKDFEQREMIRREKDEKARSLINELEDARARHTGDPTKLAELTNTIYPRLKELAQGGLGSQTAREWLVRDETNRLMPKEYVTRNNLLAKAETGSLTQEEIDGADLPQSEKDALQRYSDEARKEEFLKEQERLVGDSTKAAVLKTSKAQAPYTFGDGDKPNTDVTAYNLYNERVKDELWDYVNKKRKRGEAVSDEDIIREAGRIAEARYDLYYDRRTGKAHPIGGNKNFKFGTTAAGKSVFDITHVQTKDFTDTTVDGRFTNYKNTIVLDAATTKDELMRYRANTTDNPVGMGSRASAYLKAKPGDRLKFLISQAKHHGLPHDDLLTSPQGQRELDNARTAPRSNYNRTAAQDALTRVRADRELQIIRSERERWQAQERGEQPVAPKGLTSDGGGGFFQKDAPTPDDEIFRLAISTGLSPEEAVTMTAIALAESAGIANNRNFNLSTGDRSYGLWQINMLDDDRTSYYLGRERRRDLGLSSNDELYDPATNARAMYYVLKTRKTGFKAWSVYKGEGEGRYTDHLPAARRALARWKAAQSQQQ